MFGKKVKRILIGSAMSVLMLLPSVGFASSELSDYEKIKLAADKAIQSEAASTFQSSELSAVKRDPILNEAPEFYKSIEGKTYQELTPSELQKLHAIIDASISQYKQISAIVNKNSEAPITPSYLEDETSKAIEASVYALFPTLSVSDIAISFENSNTARDIGVRYAQLQGYPVTWDNPADAYRHFSWNWLNSEDINVDDARVFGDVHELALAAASIVNVMSHLSFTEKVAQGVLLVIPIRNQTQSSLANFNAQWDNASVMDIYNNSQGRKSSLNYSFTSVADAFYDAFFVRKVIIGWTSDVNSTVRSTAYSYWQ